jgi:hypothetical protein
MELMVSIVLIVLIVLFMYGAVASSKLSNERLQVHDEMEANRTKIFTLLYNDILQSKDLKSEKTSNRKYSLLSMQSKNTIYQVAMPYIVYFVHSRSKELIRLEAAHPIELPIKYDDKRYIHADIILSDVTDFNIYTSSENNTTKADQNTTLSSHQTLLIYLKQKSWLKPMLFELSI